MINSTDKAFAINGGPSQREVFLPYGTQVIDARDIEAVTHVLKSDYLTTGPAVPAFEKAMREKTGAKVATAFSSGTSALHACMKVFNVGEGDEVIVPAITFSATANVVMYSGAKPVFADVELDTMNVSAQTIEACITPKTKAVIAVDYAGQPCQYNHIETLLRSRGIVLIIDACHSLGGGL